MIVTSLRGPKLDTVISSSVYLQSVFMQLCLHAAILLLIAWYVLSNGWQTLLSVHNVGLEWEVGECSNIPFTHNLKDALCPTAVPSQPSFPIDVASSNFSNL